MDFQYKDFYRIDDLIRIMHILRAPDGCPWDRVQTHESIRQNFIEETYEAIEAIDKGDSPLLKEELGDVLMQVIFHSIMEEEAGRFDFDDVCNDVCQKLIIRHPHVFGNIEADTPDEVLRNWDAIKMQTKSQEKVSDSVDDVAKSLPALMRAQKVQKRSAKSGMDFKDAADAASKIPEEQQELFAAIDTDDKDKIEEELGDLLFSVVNVARFAGVDAERALTRSTEKFSKRFRAVEELAEERGIDMKNAPISLIDSLWEEIK
ncbi:MAG: nucleoside triphosphate pyrophosphohydrolase [Ruminococcus sp.]|uniref:nucleoside triphosphate pyrophosphohydrolase n=1 Tax=Ruminococcus sp. TaxID=41978 RepID=UPI0028732254|nr:nucleoside triphosphate pyrophosphohydrolase [Ruminococcus sp.]MBQ3286200.1 nucleoside triphosphate pyrophosphohydrolase [Ruminococcus sp.]